MIIGIDPGLSGAICVYSLSYGVREIVNIPTYEVIVNKKRREKVDDSGLFDIFTRIKSEYCPEGAVIEEVSSRREDGHVGAFKFGWTCATIYTCCKISGIKILEMIRPQVWKPKMKIPSGSDKKASVARADELFPEFRDMWRGPRGGMLPDRAEATLIAHYWATKHAGIKI